ncbi:MAG: hypothetical protein QOJ03_1992 [Frankiaceae bacterium]|jgi:hypothetical protein|nr:hypothetical protein [Frankiaceae bacterium]
MTRRLLAASLAAAAITTACSGSSSPAPGSPSPTASPGPSTLAVGKSDLALTAGTYRSPEGFLPPLLLDLPAGWTSVHRAADAFDIGRAAAAGDAPDVAVIFMTPAEDTAAAAIAAVRGRVTGTVRSVGGTVGGRPAQGLDISGGKGELASSTAGAISIDAGPGQRERVLAVDAAGRPLLVIVLVPDAKRWAAVLPDAVRLFSGLRFA